MDAVLLALLAGATAGASNVWTRVGIGRVRDVDAASLTMIVVSFVVVGAIAAGVTRQAPAWDELWPYLIVGVFVPGLLTILFIWAVREAGPSRTAVIINTFPLFAAALAIVFLDEPLRAGLAVGTVLVVLGAVGIAAGAAAPAEYRGAAFRLALVVMLICAAFVGGRDTVVRWASEGQEISSLVGAAATMASGSATVLLYVVYRSIGARQSLSTRVRPALVPFGAIGALAAVNTMLIFEAFERGRVTVVSPLIGTAMLWTLVFSVAAFGRGEGLGKRIVGSALLVAGGVALIGVTRGSGA